MTREELKAVADKAWEASVRAAEIELISHMREKVATTAAQGYLGAAFFPGLLPPNVLIPSRVNVLAWMYAVALTAFPDLTVEHDPQSHIHVSWE